MFRGTQKSQFYFSIDHYCEVTVKSVYEIIGQGTFDENVDLDRGALT